MLHVEYEFAFMKPCPLGISGCRSWQEELTFHEGRTRTPLSRRGEGLGVRTVSESSLPVMKRATAIDGALPAPHQLPVFSIDAQGSCEGSGSPRWRSSIEMPSGDLMKAM